MNKYNDILIAIIHGGGNWINLCIQSIDKYIDEPNILVIDNSVEQDYYNESVEVYKTGGNLNFSESYNNALNNIDNEYIMIINDDIIFNNSSINNIYKHRLIKTNIYGISLYYYNKPKTLWAAGGIYSKLMKSIKANKDIRAVIQNVDYVPAAFLVISKYLWDSAGGFNPQYCMGYEELELANIIKKKFNGNALIITNISALHVVGYSDWKNNRSIYNNIRNKYIYLRNMNLFIRIIYVFILSLNDVKIWNNPKGIKVIIKALHDSFRSEPLNFEILSNIN